ncbi:MAG: hypothetical protein ACRBDL_11500 [Alphaproteobacteria bacterium]
MQVNYANEVLEQRLLSKTEQVELYKERALYYEEQVKYVVDYDEVDLKEKALEVVGNIREFNARFKRESDRTIIERPLSSQQSKEQRQADLHTRNYKIALLSNERDAEYNRRFRVSAMMLRDELRSRLPDYQPQVKDTIYEYPINYHGYVDVASDLERMAKMLTSQAIGTPQSGAPY